MATVGDKEVRAAIVNRLARAIAEKLAGHPLLLADGLLDEARRFFLASQMSGVRDEAVIAHLGTPAEAVGIAGRCIGLSIEEMLKVDELIRWGLWSAHFATMPETRFGQLFTAKLAEATDEEGAKETLN